MPSRPTGCIPTDRQVQKGFKEVGRPGACMLSCSNSLLQSADHCFAMWTPNALLQSSTGKFRTYSYCPVGQQDTFRPTDRCRWLVKESADQVLAYCPVAILCHSRPTIPLPCGHRMHFCKALQASSGHTLNAQLADWMHSDRPTGAKGLQRSRPTRCLYAKL